MRLGEVEVGQIVVTPGEQPTAVIVDEVDTADGTTHVNGRWRDDPRTSVGFAEKADAEVEVIS
jgi:hypothetical protein